MAPISAAIPPMTWTAPLPTSSCTSNLARTVIGFMHESINLFSIRVVLPELVPFGSVEKVLFSKHIKINDPYVASSNLDGGFVFFRLGVPFVRNPYINNKMFFMDPNLKQGATSLT